MMVANSLTLAAWLVSGKPFRVKEFQKTLLTFSQIPGEKAHSLIMSQPGGNGLADFLFNYGSEYRTIHLYKSAISDFHEYIDHLPVGKYPEICSSASALFNSKPFKPRYMFLWMFIWDFVKEEFEENDQLSNKEVTLKVTISLALKHHLEYQLYIFWIYIIW